jgi:hypothetical protein
MEKKLGEVKENEWHDNDYGPRKQDDTTKQSFHTLSSTFHFFCLFFYHVLCFFLIGPVFLTMEIVGLDDVMKSVYRKILFGVKKNSNII